MWVAADTYEEIKMVSLPRDKAVLTLRGKHQVWTLRISKAGTR